MAFAGFLLLSYLEFQETSFCWSDNCFFITGCPFKCYPDIISISSKKQAVSYLLQRRLQNPIEYLQWRVFAKIVNGLYPLAILAKSSIADVELGSKYAYVITTAQFNLNLWFCEILHDSFLQVVTNRYFVAQK